MAEEERQKDLFFNEEAEQALLGALLLSFSVDSLDTISLHINWDDFYKSSHKIIFKTVVELSETGREPDILTLTEQLKINGDLEKAGGVVQLATLTSYIPSSSNIESFAKIVKEMSLKRSLFSLSRRINEQVKDNTQSASTILERTERDIFDISNVTTRGSIVSIKDIIGPTVEKIQERIELTKKGGSPYSGTPCGYTAIDDLTGGFQDAEMIIIGARPSIGKTAIALSMASNIAIRQNIPCGFFTLEMSSLSLMQRIISSEARISSSKMKSGLMGRDEIALMMDASTKIYEAPLFIEDTPNIRLLDLRVQARRLVLKESVKIIFIDYVGLITPDDSNRNSKRFELIAEVSRSLKSLARELNIPIVVLSQVRRDAEGKAPGLADLRESGSLEQDADVVMFLHRDRIVESAVEEGVNSSSQRTQIIIAKQRNGPTDTVELAFVPEYTRFENMEYSSH